MSKNGKSLKIDYESYDKLKALRDKLGLNSLPKTIKYLLDSKPL